MPMAKLGVAMALALSCLGVSTSALRLPDAISSNMVLAREPLAARLWGFGDKSETITVSLDGVSKAASVDASGKWVVTLDMKQASTGKTIEIVSTSGESATLENVAFGDVYLCSGQSNMEMSVNDAFDAAAEIADSVNYPDLRLYTKEKATADVPQFDGGSKAPYQWAVSAPEAFVPVGGAHYSYFSATCYFFGRDLYNALDGKVPIGLVASSWGGQKVEVFSSPDALADQTCGGIVPAASKNAAQPGATTVFTPLEQEDWVGLQNVSVRVSDSQLWNAMIYPFLNMRFTGATWYQGESNAGNPTSYACRFPAMIADWRTKFQLPDLSFFFVQLAAFQNDYAEIRNAQMAALQLPTTGYATAIDLGDPTAPLGSIHPRRKQEIGRRLALACQNVQYGMDVVPTGPVFKSFSADATSLQVTFDEATSAGLHLAGTAACTTCCNQSPFEVQVSPSYSWRRTGAPIVNSNVVTAPFTLAGNEVVVGVRFDWEGYPQCGLYNGQGGPDDRAGIAAAPFRDQQPLPVKSWKPVFRQTLPGIWQSGTLSVNPQDEDADMFARLDDLQDMLAADGSIEFKLRWVDPYSNEVNHWKQTSNPYAKAQARVSGVEGYEPLDVQQPNDGFGGLQWNPNGQSILDGQPGSNNWWHAIGTVSPFNSGMPAYTGRVAKAAELFALNPNTSKWTIVFRQTVPHFWTYEDPWSVNSDDPHAEAYSILDQLERFRGSDGKFEFKMTWPDYWNVWIQTSNPATPTPVSGYSPVDVQYTDQNFGGLEWNDGDGTAMIKGSIGTNNWFYAVGYEGAGWGKSTIPAWGSNIAGVQQVELLVNVAQNSLSSSFSQNAGNTASAQLGHRLKSKRGRKSSQPGFLAIE